MTHNVDAWEDDLRGCFVWRCECLEGVAGFETLDDAYTDALNHADEAS
jgi:hypothetical protein